MTSHYSNPKRQADPHALPNIEVFELTAREVAETDEELIVGYMHKHEFRLASMNTQTRDKMFDAMIEAEGISGGFFYWFCFPGCLPDSEPVGPYPTHRAALKAAQGELAP